jgi:hypothetical protein
MSARSGRDQRMTTIAALLWCPVFDDSEIPSKRPGWGDALIAAQCAFYKGDAKRSASPPFTMVAAHRRVQPGQRRRGT